MSWSDGVERASTPLAFRVSGARVLVVTVTSALMLVEIELSNKTYQNITALHKALRDHYDQLSELTNQAKTGPNDGADVCYRAAKKTEDTASITLRVSPQCLWEGLSTPCRSKSYTSQVIECEFLFAFVFGINCTIALGVKNKQKNLPTTMIHAFF